MHGLHSRDARGSLEGCTGFTRGMHGLQKHDTDTSCYRASPMTAPVAPGFYSSRCMPHAKSGVAGFRAAGAARERGAGGGQGAPHYLSVKQHFIGSRIIILDDPHVRLPASRTRAKLSISGEAGCGPRDSRRRKRQGAGATAPPLELLARPDAPRTPNPDARVARNLAVSRTQDSPSTYRSPTP